MSKPRIASIQWQMENENRTAIYNDKYNTNGSYRAGRMASPWVALTPESEHHFGSHADAVRHLVKLGWRKE